MAIFQYAILWGESLGDHYSMCVILPVLRIRFEHFLVKNPEPLGSRSQVSQLQAMYLSLSESLQSRVDA